MSKSTASGPGLSGIYSDNYSILAHERIAIVDPISGKQPLINKEGNLILSVNGEIYNRRELKADIANITILKLSRIVR